MRVALALVPAVLLLPAVGPPAALAGPDPVTGGVTVPDGRLTGGGADAGQPLPGPALPERSPNLGGAPAALAAQEGEPPTQTPAPEPDEGEVDVQVPLDAGDREPAATRPPPSAEPLGGLAQTGFSAPALALFGAVSAAAGLTLRRLARRLMVDPCSRTRG